MDDWSPEPSDASFDAYLRGDRKFWEIDADLTTHLQELGIAKTRWKPMIKAAMESFVENTYRAAAVDQSSVPAVRMSGPEAPRIWVHTENLFVAFVQKTEDNADQGGRLFNALSEALLDWNPPFLPTVLAFARGVVARGGFRSESITLSDHLLQAGWMFHSVSGAADERTDRLRRIIRTTIEPAHRSASSPR